MSECKTCYGVEIMFLTEISNCCFENIYHPKNQYNFTQVSPEKSPKIVTTTSSLMQMRVVSFILSKNTIFMKIRSKIGMMILSGMFAQIGWNIVSRAVAVNNATKSITLIKEGILEPLSDVFIKTSFCEIYVELNSRIKFYFHKDRIVG